MPAPSNETLKSSPPWIAGHPVVVDVVVHHDELPVDHDNEPSLLRQVPGLNFFTSYTHNLTTQVSWKRSSEEGNLWVGDGGDGGDGGGDGLLKGQGPVKQHTHLLILIIKEKLS